MASKMSKVGQAQSNIESKWQKWAEKHGGKKQSHLLQKKKELPKPSVAPKTKPPSFVQKGSEFESADQKWNEKSAAGKFNKSGKVNVGGAHEKEFWTDENGDKWLFKPARNSKDNFIAHGEEAAYKIGRLIDPDAIEVRTIQLNGRTGSIQKWRTDLKSEIDFRNILPEDLTTVELEQLQREHVIDWLVANHDGHSKQFIRGRNGHVYGIDKGQAFKHLGKDRLSLDYHPNSAFGEEEPFYNKVFRAAKEGKVNFDPQVTLKYIQEVEKIPDEAYLDIIRPYAEGRFGKDKIGLDKFYEQALQRKHDLRKDFERYYGEVLSQKGFRFSSLQSKPGIKKLLKQADEKIIDDAGKLGWQGKTLPFDSGDVEDQNALIFTETFKGKQRTVVKMKIRPDTDSKITALLRKQLDLVEIKKGQPLHDDTFFPTILEAVKNVNFHVGDGNYNRTKLAKAEKLRTRLLVLARSKDPEVKKMADSYIKWLDEIKEAVDWDRATNGIFEQYLPELPKQAKPKKPDFKVTKGKVTHTKRRISGGKITVEMDDIDNYAMFNRDSRMQDGLQFTAEFDDGTRLKYRP